MTEAPTYPLHAEDKAAEAEISRMSEAIDGFLVEMVQSQKVIDRLHKENLSRINRIEAAVERLANQ